MDNNTAPRKIEIGEDTIKDIDTTRKWTMFLAVLGFIGIGLIIIFGIFAGIFLTIFSTSEALAGLPEWSVFIFVILIGTMFVFPGLFLFRYSKYSAEAVKKLDGTCLQKAVRNLKAYFVSTGILIIMILTVYLAAIIIAGASVAHKGM